LAIKLARYLRHLPAKHAASCDGWLRRQIPASATTETLFQKQTLEL
jgi:hypothetical protein